MLPKLQHFPPSPQKSHGPTFLRSFVPDQCVYSAALPLHADEQSLPHNPTARAEIGSSWLVESVEELAPSCFSWSKHTSELSPQTSSGEVAPSVRSGGVLMCCANETVPQKKTHLIGMRMI